jgi:integrase
MDVHRDSLVLPNRKNPNQTTKRVFLPGAELGLTGELLLWAKEQELADDEPLFFSRKGGSDGSRRALQRGQAWLIVKQASERAVVHVLALRTSKHGPAGAPAPVHPHLFRHARVRQIVRQTKSLPLAQRQAGWARLQPAYLSIGDVEAREMMRCLTD